MKENRRKRAPRNLKDIESVLILFHLKDWLQIQLIADDLIKAGKKVFLWTVDSSEKKQVMKVGPPYPMRILYRHDFSFTKIIEPAIEAEFERLQYDTLIDFCYDEDSRDIIPMSYLLAINNANLCIGCRKEMANVYDITFIQREDAKVLDSFAQIKEFLSNIAP